MRELPNSLVDFAETHHGVLPRAEIDRAGLTRRQLDGFVASRRLERVGRRVYRIVGAPRPILQRVLVACVDARGVASHRTAAALHGLPGFELDEHRIEVLVHEAQNSRSPLARLRTTSTLDDIDVVDVDGIPTTSVARTLLSLASIAGLAKTGKEMSEWAVSDAFDRALADRKVSVGEITETLERLRRSGRGGVCLIERLLDERSEGAITESVLERKALEVIASAGLPRPRCQARIAPDGEFVARVDFLYPGPRAVIEVSGYRWHRTEAQMDRDTNRRRDLTHAGFEVYEFTYRQVTRSPQVLVATIRRILARQDRAGPERAVA